MSTQPTVIVTQKKKAAPPPPCAPEGLDAVTPFVRAVVSGSACASWCAGILAGFGWALLRPIVIAVVTAGGFVFGVFLWACAVAGLLALIGWMRRVLL